MVHNKQHPKILLREVQENDLGSFFQHQLDPKANWMAAFTSKDPTDRAAFNTHWIKIMHETSIIIRTILIEEQVAGFVLKYELMGDAEISYWIGRQFWGKGIATAALTAFLEELPIRPLHARAAKDNIASIRVLEKCGFTITGTQRGFANARGKEIEEVVLLLE